MMTQQFAHSFAHSMPHFKAKTIEFCDLIVQWAVLERLSTAETQPIYPDLGLKSFEVLVESLKHCPGLSQVKLEGVRGMKVGFRLGQRILGSRMAYVGDRFELFPRSKMSQAIVDLKQISKLDISDVCLKSILHEAGLTAVTRLEVKFSHTLSLKGAAYLSEIPGYNYLNPSSMRALEILTIPADFVLESHHELLLGKWKKVRFHDCLRTLQHPQTDHNS